MCEQLNNIDLKHKEGIYSELTIRNKYWIIISVYRSPLYSNLKNVVEELEYTLNTLWKVENIIVLRDINVNCHNHNYFHYMNNLSETFNFKNLI